MVLAADGLPPEATGRAVREYLEVFDDAASGGARPVVPKYLAPSDPASRFTAATPERAFFAYSTNYLIDLARKIARSVHEGARDMARDIANSEAYVTSRRHRKKVEMLFAHLKRILKLDRLRLRGPNGAKDEFLLAATAQNLRKMAKVIPLAAQTRPA